LSLDVNGDGMADIVGLALPETTFAFATGDGHVSRADIRPAGLR